MVRRQGERRGAYFLDRFDALTLGIIVGLLGLTLVDGVLTIELLDTNSEELNPLMRHLLDRGYGAFFLGKYLLTASGLPLLLVYKNYPMFGTRFRVGYLLPLFLSLYLILTAYQVHLLNLGHVAHHAIPSGGPVAGEVSAADLVIADFRGRENNQRSGHRKNGIPGKSTCLDLRSLIVSPAAEIDDEERSKAEGIGCSRALVR